MSRDSATDERRIADCRRLYVENNGRDHEAIERRMRRLGHTRFRRRILYTRKKNGRTTPGWIDRYGWRNLIKNEAFGVPPLGGDAGRLKPVLQAHERRSEPGAIATGFLRRGSRIKRSRQKMRRLIKEAKRAAAVRNSSFSRPLRNDGPAKVGTPDPRDDFHAWLRSVSPGMDWDERHQRYIYEHLRRVTGGTCKRLMIFMPPRHGKSELVTVRYAAWRLRQNPRLNVILAGYNQQLANRFSRKIRKVLTDDFALTAGAGADSIGAAGIPPCRHACCRESNGPNNSDPACTEACRSSEVPVRMFPFTSQKPKNSVAEWETAVGGGLRAVGTGGGVTGFGADLVIIDDPVKSRAEAESKKFRDRVWNWFTDDIQTRLEPDGAVILIQTRWHEDDLAGRLIKQAEEEGMEQWKIIDLPALAEDGLTAETQRRRADGDREGTPDRANTGSSKPARETSISDVLSLRLRVSAVKTPGDPLGRAAGAALWPARFDETALHNLKRSLGSYSFAALYQQRPVPAEGGTFKRHWFKHIVPRAPDGLKWFRAYDLAVSTKQTADYTASFRIAFDAGGDMYIDGGFRRRLEFPEQRRYIIGRVTEERDTSHGIELAIHGSAMMQDLKRKATLQGRPIRGVEVRDDKLTRALVWSPLVEEGRVKLVRAAWNDEFIDEACAFPGGAHDDQIDAVSMAVQMAKAASGKLWVF